jgi:hypothetical protein
MKEKKDIIDSILDFIFECIFDSFSRKEEKSSLTEKE